MTQDVLAFVRENEVKFVDLRFTTLLGRNLHMTVPVAELTAERLAAGFTWASSPHDGRRRLVPAPDTAFIDPFCQHPTLAWICDMRDAGGQDSPDDPRAVARRAEAYLASTGIATEARFATELQFFVFDQVSYDQTINGAHYRVDAREGEWRRGRDEPDNLGMQLRVGEGRTPLPPADSLHNLRSEMVAALTACGIACSAHQHGVATGGQAQLSLGPGPLLRAADQLMTCKYIVRSVAARHGKIATFMAQPLFFEWGSGQIIRPSLWKDGRSLLDDAGMVRQARAGWHRHAGSLMAFTCPTTNSYRRVWTSDDLDSDSGPASDEIEFRAADPGGNPYLGLSALLLSILDGIAGQRDQFAGSQDRGDRHLPQALREALAALEADHAYLLKGDVFSEELVGQWLEAKRREVDALLARPHPYEFCMYFDA
jgi:glutamine synthetase